MTTPLTLTEIWDRQLGATADKLELPYSGGRSGDVAERLKAAVLKTAEGETPS